MSRIGLVFAANVIPSFSAIAQRKKPLLSLDKYGRRCADSFGILDRLNQLRIVTPRNVHARIDGVIDELRSGALTPRAKIESPEEEIIFRARRLIRSSREGDEEPPDAGIGQLFPAFCAAAHLSSR